EIGSVDGKTVANALLNRVTSALCGSLTIDEIKQIQISFHVFPDQLAEQGLQDPPDLTLYPDQESSGDSGQGARLLKRVLDLTGSLLGLILLSPLLLAIAAAIKMT